MTVAISSKSQLKFGSNLRKIREHKQLSQEEVANLIGISVTYYAGIERGTENPTFAVLEQMCKSLSVKSSQLLPF